MTVATSVSSMPASNTDRRQPSIAALRTMPVTQIREVFRHLQAPAVRELDGEYAATLLDQGSDALNLLSRLAINLSGRWLCKAFHPTSETEGHGYNSFSRRGRIVHHFRMKTYVAPSEIDAGDSYYLLYRPYNWGLMKTMVDEVRRVSDGIYLGLGRLGFTAHQRERLFPFLLEGPAAPFAPIL